MTHNMIAGTHDANVANKIILKMPLSIKLKKLINFLILIKNFGTLLDFPEFS